MKTPRLWRAGYSSFLIFLLILFSGVSVVRAETPAKENRDVLNGPFAAGRFSLQLVCGALFSLTNLPADSPVLDYAQTNLRLGYMLTSPGPEESFLRGTWEVLGEISNAVIFKGFGNYIGGITCLFRYNFVQPDWRLIPYVQGGAGIVYNDAYKDKTQQAIGQAIEFTPQFSIGCRYLLTRSWSFDVEGMFHHISNADMADRNRSINALGGFIGVSYHFPDR